MLVCKKYQVLQGHFDQQRHVGLGKRPTVVGKKPTTAFLNSAEFSVVKKIKVAWEGIDIHSIKLGLGWGGCGGFC